MRAAEALRKVPWVPPGFRDHGSPEANVAALLRWADDHRGPEAEAIEWALGELRTPRPPITTEE